MHRAGAVNRGERVLYSLQSVHAGGRRFCTSTVDCEPFHLTVVAVQRST